MSLIYLYWSFSPFIQDHLHKDIMIKTVFYAHDWNILLHLPRWVNSLLHFLKDSSTALSPALFSSNRKATIKVINVNKFVTISDSLNYITHSYINVCIKVQLHFVKHSCFLLSIWTGILKIYVFISYWNIIIKLLFYGTIWYSMNFWSVSIPSPRHFLNWEKHQESAFLMSRVSM